MDRKKNVPIATGAQHNRVSGMSFNFSAYQITGDNSLGMTVHHHHVQHFSAGKHLYLSCGHLAHQCTIGAQQQLLSGLAPGIKGSRNLGAAKGAVGQQAAVIPGKGDALGHALIDDVVADLGQTMYIGFTGTEVAPFDRIVKKSPDACRRHWDSSWRR